MFEKLGIHFSKLDSYDLRKEVAEFLFSVRLSEQGRTSYRVIIERIDFNDTEKEIYIYWSTEAKKKYSSSRFDIILTVDTKSFPNYKEIITLISELCDLTFIEVEKRRQRKTEMTFIIKPKKEAELLEEKEDELAF